MGELLWACEEGEKEGGRAELQERSDNEDRV